MTRLVMCVFTILLFPHWGQAQMEDKDREAVAAEVDFGEPPFWMFTYEEFGDLQKPQKDFYIRNAGPALRRIQGLEKISQTKLEEAPDWYKTWDSIMKQVYIACQTKPAQIKCTALADVRIRTLKMR